MFNLIASVGSVGNLIWVSISLICFLVVIISMGNFIFQEIRVTYKKKRTRTWDYKFYKNYGYVLGHSATEVLELLAKSNFSDEEKIKAIDDFNSLDPNSRHRLTFEMIGFQKRVLEESEPARKISKAKSGFVRTLEEKGLVG